MGECKPPMARRWRDRSPGRNNNYLRSSPPPRVTHPIFDSIFGCLADDEIFREPAACHRVTGSQGALEGAKSFGIGMCHAAKRSQVFGLRLCGAHQR